MNKKTYIIPAMAVVEVRCEKGFAESSVIGVPQVELIELLNYEANSQETETFSVRDGWGDEPSNGFWL